MKLLSYENCKMIYEICTISMWDLANKNCQVTLIISNKNNTNTHGSKNDTYRVKGHPTHLSSREGREEGIEFH